MREEWADGPLFQFVRETDRDSEEKIRSGQAQAGALQEYRHFVVASAAVGVEVKGRVPATFRVPGAVRGGHAATEGEVTSTTITGVDLRHIDSIEPMVEVVDRVQGVGRAVGYGGKHEVVVAGAAPEVIRTTTTGDVVVA